MLMASDVGRMLSLTLLFVGALDLCAAFFLFGKRVRQTQDLLLHAVTPEQTGPLEAQLKTKQMVQYIISITGIVFIMFGFYGLAH